jgi:hypothetical protein
VQRIGISCADPIEKEYYNPLDNKRTWFNTRLICALCTSETNVMEQVVLENEKLTEGKKCLPMCRGCKSIGLKPAKQSSKSRTDNVKKRSDTQGKRNEAQSSRKKQKRVID